MISNYPHIIIAGFPRCGTTSLYETLIQSDLFVGPRIKEPNFFTLHHGRGSDWYDQLWPRTSADPTVTRIEASTTFGFSERSAQLGIRRLSQVNPHVRLIFMFRDPVERAVSHYAYRQARDGYIWKSASECIARHPEVVAASHYSAILRAVADNLPVDQIHLVPMAQALTDEGLKEICQFVGFESGALSDLAIGHKNSSPTNRSLAVRLSGLAGNHKMRKRLLRVVPRPVVVASREALFNRRGGRQRVVSSEDEAYIRSAVQNLARVDLPTVLSDKLAIARDSG